MGSGPPCASRTLVCRREVIAYATYPAGGVFQRSDVATRVVGGNDLARVLAIPDSDEVRATALEATAGLLRSLERAGARTPT